MGTRSSNHEGMKIILTDENYEFAVDYTLDFDVIGKIEIDRLMNSFRSLFYVFGINELE